GIIVLVASHPLLLLRFKYKHPNETLGAFMKDNPHLHLS
ncbi:hypothetical protein CDAR_563341, partial [Caerostris darwini]